MWTRAELKSRGKVAMRANRVRTIMCAVFLSFAAQGIVFDSTGLTTAEIMNSFSGAEIIPLTQLLNLASTGLLLTLICDIFFFNILEVGCRHFFVENARMPAKCGECLYSFRNRYWNTCLVMFLKGLYTFLWTCLFIVPGIVKAYAYRMVPYILADNSNLEYKEVISLSQEMMKGNKWKSFLLDLSFLGWNILSTFTCGILGFVYVYPYIYCTDAELYLKIRGPYLNEIHPDGYYDNDVDAGYGNDWYGYEDGYYDEPDRHDDDYYG